jgi:uncharacterized protein YjbI with pentapeptide repeats
VANGKRNSFKGVDFSNADLRQTVYVSADMADCTFADGKLSNVDFQGTVFVNCRFQGQLNDVLFHRYAFRGEAFPPNEMKGVDFSRAKLRHVEFRGLHMATATWPQDDDHILLNDYLATLDRVLDALKTRTDVESRKLAAVLGSKRKWAGANQKQGVISKLDLIEAGGEGAVLEFLRLAQPPKSAHLDS